MNSEKKEFGAWWAWVLALIVLSGFVFGGLRWFGLTAERLSFEASYQRSSAQLAKRQTLEAELIGVQALLGSNALTVEERADMAARAAGLQFQLEAME